MSKVIVICGPTASGKTALAVECAKRLNGEVISADSMLIYKYCNIGTAKPNALEMQGIKHHMIDIVEPESEFSVSDYESTAIPIIEKLIAEGKIPIICGGTGFYIKALLFKSHFGSTPKNDELRKKYETILNEKGSLYLYELLKEVDIETSLRLHYNDVKRVIRALEIYDLTGKKKSEQKDKDEQRFDFKCFQYDFDREILYNRINQRVDIMFDNGLIDEVKHLISRGITEKNQCMQGIGYKEIYFSLKENLSEKEMSEKIKQNTRNYAKRQITFFKKFPNITNLPSESADISAERIFKEL